ncbi:MAG: hypothetical protein ACLSCW_07890 [Gemmiger formicilis]
MIALKRHGWSRALGLDLAAHLTLTQQLFPRSYIGTLLNGVTWTLTVFALFYLVFPLLAPLCAKHPPPTLGALCLVQAGYSQWALHQYGTGEYALLFNQFLAFCGVLAVGMAAALVFARLARGGWAQRLLPRAGCTVLGALALVWLNAQSAHTGVCGGVPAVSAGQPDAAGAGRSSDARRLRTGSDPAPPGAVRAGVAVGADLQLLPLASDAGGFPEIRPAPARVER